MVHKTCWRRVCRNIEIIFKCSDSSSGLLHYIVLKLGTLAHCDSLKATIPTKAIINIFHRISSTSPLFDFFFFPTNPRLGCVTLVRLRAALSFPPGVRFLSWTSSSSTSWAMARTVDGTSPGCSGPLVCSASSLKTIAAVSPERSWKPNRVMVEWRETGQMRWEVNSLEGVRCQRRAAQKGGEGKGKWK